MMKYAGFLFLLSTYFFSLHAQEQIAINGKVTDDRQLPIAYASVHLLNTHEGTLTDSLGLFSLPHLDKGIYTLQISAVGYATITRQIFTGKKSSELIFSLLPSARQLDEVVVSAEKKEEMLQHLPLSVTALSSRQVNDYRLWNSKELTAIVPNLYTADPGDKRNVTFIRGIGTTSYDPAVATYIDGVNQFGLDTYISPLFDVERIEILRGPQGTLYGRNAMGGVINIITKQPANKTEGFAQVSAGKYGMQRYTAGVRMPLIKNKLFFGAAGLYDAFDGFYTNKYTQSAYDKQKSIGGNYYLKYMASSRWAWTLNVKHLSNRNHGPFPLVFGVEEAFAHPYQLNQNATTQLVDNTLNTSLSVNYTGKFFNFSSLSSYQTNYRFYTDPIDADFSPIDGISIINNYGKDWNKVKVATQEFKFSSPAGTASPLNWTAGTYWFYQDNPVKQTTRFGKDAGFLGVQDKNFSLINSTKGKGSGAAIYGQLTYHITHRWEASIGARYDYEHKKQSILGEYQHDPNPNPMFAYRTDTSAAATFHAFSPKVNITYLVTKNNRIYATYSKGFRAGGLTPLSSDPSQPALYAFNPEYSHNIEAGSKNTFYNNRILLNVAAFYSMITDVQVPSLVLPDAVTITRNTGKLTSKGVEAEVNAAVAKGLEINYSFGYTDATYKQLALSQNGAEANLRGKRQLFTPDVTSMLAAQYNIEFKGKQNPRFFIRGEWKYLGTQYFDLSNTLAQSSYQLLNTSAGFSMQHVSIMFWVRNATDKRYISYAYDFGAVHLADPRTYGVTLTGRFF